MYLLEYGKGDYRREEETAKAQSIWIPGGVERMKKKKDCEVKGTVRWIRKERG